MDGLSGGMMCPRIQWWQWGGKSSSIEPRALTTLRFDAPITMVDNHVTTVDINY